MSNIFISHSSLDKPFVKKLALALLSDGFPVWLDSWELEAGDSLLDGVYSGIDSSSIVLLIISDCANKSGWVNREVNAALAKEQQVGRKFLIPIKIDESDLPLKIADRLYGDFSKSFASPLETLTTILEKFHPRELPVPPEREVLPLDFSNEVHLNKNAYSRAVRNIYRRQSHPALASRQIRVATDEHYDRLRTKLQTRLDNVESDPFYSPDFEQSLRNTEESIRDYEGYLRKGIALIASHNLSSESAYWYARILRGRIVYTLWSAQSPNDPDPLDYGKTWGKAFLSSNTTTAEFFEVAQTKPVDLPFPATASTPAGYFHFFMDAAEIEELFMGDVYLGPGPVKTVCGPHAIAKFIFPQMVLAHVAYGDGPIPWDLDNVSIGVH